MYRVFENGKPTSEYGIKGWEVDTFETKREAEVHAFHWAYPMPKSSAEEFAPEMDIGVEYDYSQCEFPLLMSIEEVVV